MENKKIEFESDGLWYTIRARNVGKKNPEATIQITIERYDILNERNKPFVELSIPEEHCEQFIKSILPQED